MQPAEQGYFQARVAEAGDGTLYRYSPDGQGPWPDPCSRFQPMGPHGPSQVVDPSRFQWSDGDRRGAGLQGQVYYELHIGTFTADGTFDSAIDRLPYLKDLGVTVLELLPVAEFPGSFNWGYDGVDLFAPFHGYGDARAIARFIDAAHALGLAVVLDVVYNHLGPDGNYLTKYSPHYFTDRYANDWGASINFDGPHSHGVRAFFCENARYWIEDLHFDGLRLDATQSIHDGGRDHVLADIVDAARAASPDRPILISAENEPQIAYGLLSREQGGYGFDAMWNDDFHHSARVAATGRHEGYFNDYRGAPQEFISAAKRGFLYQGQHYAWQKQRRGTPVTSQPAASFIVFTQNHDQVANTLYGQRLHEITSPGRDRALTALLLLGPWTPMLFMGQEFIASAPFPFFADHHAELRSLVHAGRREFMSQFVSYATPAAQARVLDPGDEAVFRSAKLDWSELDKARHAQTHAMVRDLLRVRREDPVVAAQDRRALDGAVLGATSFALRFFAPDPAMGDRLLVVNLGPQCELDVVPEPLLVAPPGADWKLAWSSDDPAFGGPGTSPQNRDGRWNIGGEQATLLVATRSDDGR